MLAQSSVGTVECWHNLVLAIEGAGAIACWCDVVLALIGSAGADVVSVRSSVSDDVVTARSSAGVIECWRDRVLARSSVGAMQSSVGADLVLVPI